MNILSLVIKNILYKPLNSFLCILLIALGVGIISLLSHTQIQLNDTFTRNASKTDIVVGAKGSPLQLILSSIFHIDSPTGNISLKEAEKLKKNPLIASAIPLSYGDNYAGFRIVGTRYEYLELYGAEISEGKLWAGVYEAVIGEEVAKKLNLKIGDEFASAHGFMEGGEVHDDEQYIVVGILKPSYSVLDQLILTSLESVWEAHEHLAHEEESKGEAIKDETHEHEELHLHDDKESHDHKKSHDHEDEDNHAHHHEEDDRQITALLLKIRNPIGLMQIPRQINKNTQMQAASPLFEVGRLMNLSDQALKMIEMIAYLIMLVAGLSVFISLYNNLKNRKGEMALMRVYGASRKQLVYMLILEALILSAIGFIAGLILSRLGLWVVNFYINSTIPAQYSGFHFIIQEFWLLLMALAIALTAALLPAVNAFQLNISKTLQND